MFSAVVHGDTTGAETVRRILSDWASDLEMIPVGGKGEVDGYIGYYEPYATSHAALDKDIAFQDEVRNAARTLVAAVQGAKEGRVVTPDRELKAPRPK
jgi:hypothetical protein